jgi:SAM-dependent methyltransferase
MFESLSASWSLIPTLGNPTSMKDIETIHEFFLQGMKRVIPAMVLPPADFALKRVHLGCGIHKLEGFVNLDLPDYNASLDPIPCEDGSVAEVRAFHVLEHLTNPIFCLGEIQRVLAPGGVANLLVPHWSSDVAYTDFTHERTFGEKVYRNLFRNQHYAPPMHGEWKFDIGMNLLIGITHRNLALITQLIKR